MIDDATLAVLPESADRVTVDAWATGIAGSLRTSSFDAARRASFTSVSAEDVADTPLFARFINGALAADWACYEAEADRADFARLRNVIDTFPRGFRLWLCRADDGSFLPVGYTGWYPISEEAFTKAYDNPLLLTHRRELWPRATLSPEGDYLWLFNYCILADLRRSVQSRMMLQNYAHDFTLISVRGLAAAVLSDESKRVVARFGMTYRGDMTHNGVSENVFAVRRG